jgi:lipid-A-disaccharide synthase-like uncharacterized protein
MNRQIFFTHMKKLKQNYLKKHVLIFFMSRGLFQIRYLVQKKNEKLKTPSIPYKISAISVESPVNESTIF